MTKVELEAKVESVTDEINFLKALYDAVSLLLTCKPLARLLSTSWRRQSSPDLYQEALESHVCF